MRGVKTKKAGKVRSISSECIYKEGQKLQKGRSSHPIELIEISKKKKRQLRGPLNSILPPTGLCLAISTVLVSSLKIEPPPQDGLNKH